MVFSWVELNSFHLSDLEKIFIFECCCAYWSSNGARLDSIALLQSNQKQRQKSAKKAKKCTVMLENSWLTYDLTIELTRSKKDKCTYIFLTYDLFFFARRKFYFSNILVGEKFSAQFWLSITPAQIFGQADVQSDQFWVEQKSRWLTEFRKNYFLSFFGSSMVCLGFFHRSRSELGMN